MTGQDLLDRMELLNQELQLQAGEADVVRGLVALNVAQDYFESLLALKGKTWVQTATAVTSSGTETASLAGVLRVDSLWILNSSSKPEYRLRKIERVGAQAGSAVWPYNITSATAANGKPSAYWVSAGSIWLQPIPDGTYTLRVYGATAAANITAAGTFLYPDLVALPLASFAVKLFKLGLDDEVETLDKLATETFTPALDSLALYNRDGAAGLHYTQTHQE